MSWERIRQSEIYHSFTQNRVAMVSAAVVLTLVLLSALAPVIAPYDPWDQTTFDIMDSEMPPHRGGRRGRSVRAGHGFHGP